MMNRDNHRLQPRRYVYLKLTHFLSDNGVHLRVSTIPGGDTNFGIDSP